MTQRRVFVVAALALLIAAAWLLRGTNQSAPGSGAVAGSGRQSATSVPGALAAAATATPSVAPASPTPAALTTLAHAAADDYRRQARYPPSSRPIEAGAQDPILRDREVSQNTFPGPGGRDPALTVFPAHVSFESPDAVVLYAYLSLAGQRVAAARIDGAVVTPDGRTVAQLSYHDDGQGADTASGDALFTAELPSEVLQNAPTASYLVRVHAVTADGEDRLGATGFLYSRPDAQLTGHYADSMVDGSLQIDAEVAVQAAGRFHLEATLYGQDGQPLAWAQNAQQFAPGIHHLPLSFYGLILREKAMDGPYVLRYVALSTATTMPNAKNRLVENAYVTQAYPVTDFSDRPFDDPNLLDTAARLERDGGLTSPAAATHSP
jgi:hypothetical protein